MTSIIFLIQLFFTFVVSQSCHQELEETICENFQFLPELILNSATNKLTLKNASGDLIHENFSNLDQIIELQIIDSQLNKIESGSLCCTPNLTSLTVINTKLPKINGKILQGCENLKKIMLDGSGIQLEDGAFNQLNNLQTLTLNATTLTELKPGFFVGLPTLKSLIIQHSPLIKITKNAFRGFDEIKVIDLQNNQIEIIEEGAFSNLPQLKVLNLSDNKIKNLTWKEFDNLKSLRVLFLERNDFETVNVDNVVTGIPNLDRIFLGYNKLKPENRKQIEEVFPKFNITFIYIGKPYEM